MKMLASKNGIILPSDIVNKMLSEYCEHDILSITRGLQYPHVQRCTQFGDMELAIKAGNLENIQWIARRNHRWKKKGGDCLVWAAQGGQLECLQWLLPALGRSCQTEYWLYVVASYGGNVDMFTWLLDNGCPLITGTLNHVIPPGNIQVLEWCRQNGCLFDDDSFFHGALTQKIKVLEWLKLHDCPWGTFSIETARNLIGALHLNGDIVNWLQANGCPKRPVN